MQKSILFFSSFFIMLLLYSCKESYHVDVYRSGKSHLSPYLSVTNFGKKDTFLIETNLPFPAFHTKQLVSIVSIKKNESIMLFKNIVSSDVKVTKIEKHKSSDSLFKIVVFDGHGFSTVDIFKEDFIPTIAVINDSISFSVLYPRDLHDKRNGVNEIQSLGVNMPFTIAEWIFYDSVTHFSKNDSIVIQLDHSLPMHYHRIKTGMFSESIPFIYSYFDYQIIDSSTDSLSAHFETILVKTYSGNNLNFQYSHSYQYKRNRLRKRRRVIEGIYSEIAGQTPR